MPAFVILDIAWHDAAKATAYREQLGPTLEKYGGRTLVANEPRVLEGDWSPRRLVIFEFPSMEAVQAWLRSPEYAPVGQLRKEGATSKIVAVERPPAP
jgi:uncharacterized protein (DUF1330 family)